MAQIPKVAMSGLVLEAHLLRLMDMFYANPFNFKSSIETLATESFGQITLATKSFGQILGILTNKA